jgi:SAM-dependent methyltransferase
MPELDPQSLFDAYYFAHGCGEPYQRSEVWLALFNAFADRICQDISPNSVLDAGCAMGFLVEALHQRGVEAWGVDISEYAIERVPKDYQPYCWQGSVVEPFPRNYNLIVCIEVLEHLSKVEAEKAVENLCKHSDDILFSSTPFDYKEASHFNVQPPEYWAEVFARRGFYRDVDFDASFITPWAVRFRRRGDPIQRIVRDYERRFWTLWKENTDLRNLAGEMRDQLAGLEADLVNTTKNGTIQTEGEKIVGRGLRSRLNGLRQWLARTDSREDA